MTVKEFKVQYALGTLEYKELIRMANTNDTEILTILSNSQNPWVRFHVANNKNTPIDVLRILSKDKNNWIKENAINSLKHLCF